MLCEYNLFNIIFKKDWVSVMKKIREKNILIVVTNASKLDDFNKTGVWLEEFALPFLTFKENGCKVVIASPLGGLAPVDENSFQCKNPTEWDYTIKDLKDTQKLSDINPDEYDAIFLPGGHGPMIDLAQDELLGKIVSDFYNKHKIVAAVCHGPAGLLNAKTLTGEHIVKGMQVTSFTNKEEKLVNKDKVVPFLLESKLKQLGAYFNESLAWAENVVVDENLITGQNPQSSRLIAETVIKKMKL